MKNSTPSAISSGMNEPPEQPAEDGSPLPTSALPKLREPLTTTNVCILRALLKHRLLTANQIQRFCLPHDEGLSSRGRSEYTRHLLRTLHRHKYLVRRQLVLPGLGRNPYVFASTWKGAMAVAEARDVPPASLGWDSHDKVMSWANENLQHLIQENEVYLIFTQSCDGESRWMEQWKSDRALWREHSGKKVTYQGPWGGHYEKVIIPDGYYLFASRVSVEGRTGVRKDRVTIEIDMGTQTLRQRQKSIKRPQRTWEHKIRAYLAYFEPGGVYEQLNGSTKGRLLIFTTVERRLKELQTLIEDMGGGQRFWLATLDLFTTESAFASPIYSVAGQGEERFRLLEDF